MLLKSVHINNFRSFKDLKIDKLGKVNLLIGENGCGKTSVLDAIFMLSGGKNPVLAVAVQNMRQLIINTNEDFKYYFRDFNLDHAIDIEAETFEKKDMKLCIKPIMSSAREINFGGMPGVKSTQDTPIETRQNNVLAGLKYEFTNCEGKKFITDFIFPRAHPLGAVSKPEILGLYINTSNLLSMSESVSALIINKAENDIIPVLKEIDKNIVGIKMISNTVYIDLDDKKELLPINIMGDGIAKIVSILAGIIRVKNGLLLIDEIENGLHYKSLKLLWKAIFKACYLYNVQIIATTHSDECLKIFSDIYAEYRQDDQSDIAVIRINKREQEHKATTYDSKNLAIAIENNIEVR